MIAGIRLKICGLTTLVDAALADQCGADYLGFITHPKSPRYVSLGQFSAMVRQLPDRPKVGVVVEPTLNELGTMKSAGFDFFQIHFRSTIPLATISGWADTVGRERLWLAPKLPPAEEVDPAWLPCAKVFLLDTYQSDGFGGSGRTGDWNKFARLRRQHPDKTWILAGGLDPENIVAAITESGTRFVDVNSGVESSPGVKDAGKMRRLIESLRADR